MPTKAFISSAFVGLQYLSDVAYSSLGSAMTGDFLQTAFMLVLCSKMSNRVIVYG